MVDKETQTLFLYACTYACYPGSIFVLCMYILMSKSKMSSFKMSKQLLYLNVNILCKTLLYYWPRLKAHLRCLEISNVKIIYYFIIYLFIYYGTLIYNFDIYSDADNLNFDILSFDISDFGKRSRHIFYGFNSFRVYESFRIFLGDVFQFFRSSINRTSSTHSRTWRASSPPGANPSKLTTTALVF
jgi:hypothetical protein